MRSDLDACLTLTDDQYNLIDSSLIQISGVMGLIIEVSQYRGEHENKNIKNSAWLVMTVIENIRNQLEQKAKPQRLPSKG